LRGTNSMPMPNSPPDETDTIEEDEETPG